MERNVTHSFAFRRVGLLLVGLMGLSGPSYSAELPIIHRAMRPTVVAVEPPCPCGAVPIRVQHRALWMGYGASYDPRTAEEPRYFYRGMKTYVRYVDYRRVMPGW